MTDPNRCCESIRDRDNSWPRFYQCSRAWKVERDGKRYCAQHDPVAVKAQDEIRMAKYRAECNASIALRERQSRCIAACEGVPTEQLEPGMLKRLMAEKAEVKSE